MANAPRMASVLLPTRRVEKPWGRDSLPAPFAAAPHERVGEIWFEPPAAMPDLLVKYIFTSEQLSVQVHPSDDQAQAVGLGRAGKEECWLVVDAAPGARLGIGFDGSIGAAAMRAAALDGSIEGRMRWFAVKPGDFFYIPAGTVHAIGAGISLIEVQQASDVTWRLYDYGRPRELHLDEAVAVARGDAYPPALHRHIPARGGETLVEGPHFRVDRIEGTPSAAIRERYRGPLLVLPRMGTVRVDGEPVRPGECALAASVDALDVPAMGQVLIAQSC